MPENPESMPMHGQDQHDQVHSSGKVPTTLQTREAHSAELHLFRTLM